MAGRPNAGRGACRCTASSSPTTSPGTANGSPWSIHSAESAVRRGGRRALSIVTSVAKSGGIRPYDDAIGTDGLHRCKLRRDERGRSDEGLRNAMLGQVTLMWFYGEAPGRFQAIFPVFLVDYEAELDQFVLAPTTESPGLLGESPLEGAVRRYLVTETKRRLHQPLFAGQVMAAYRTSCASP